ncbi:hypothetical protein, partial [Leucobacter celer]|uniref:hypothetical protein n=1 Tax=Leucobacter celer TaxID=668625 RepID=UPI000A4D253F
WRSQKLGKAGDTVVGWFKKGRYTLTTMIREAKAIPHQIDLARGKLCLLYNTGAAHARSSGDFGGGRCFYKT